jgi:hypothetical protein
MSGTRPARAERPDDVGSISPSNSK